MPLHHKLKEKEIQKKRNIKSRKIDKRKRKMFSPHMHYNSTPLLRFLLQRDFLPLPLLSPFLSILLNFSPIFSNIRPQISYYSI